MSAFAKARDTSPMSILRTLLLFAPVMIVFFLAGIYLGSSIVDYHAYPSSAVSDGLRGSTLPNTNNILLPGQLRGGQKSKAVDISPSERDISATPVAKDSPSSRSNLIAPIQEGGAVSQSVYGSAQVHVGESAARSDPDHRQVGEGGGTQDDITKALAASYHADVIGGFQIPSSLDATNIAFGVWIYLDDADDGSMRTVFSNKATGCDSSADRNGVAMFVNEWQTSDHILYVEFGNDQSGCHKVSSGSVKLVDKKWYHVVVTLMDSHVKLYLDGREVGSFTGTHNVQHSRPIQLGQYGNNEYPLIGNISHFSVAHPRDADAAAASVNALRDLTFLTEYTTLDARVNVQSLFPLHDLTKGATSKRDLIGNLVGKLQTAPSSKTVSGVKIKLVDGLEQGREVTEDMRKESDALGRTR